MAAGGSRSTSKGLTGCVVSPVPTATADEAWALLSDFLAFHRWHPRVTKCRLASPSAAAALAMFETRRQGRRGWRRPEVDGEEGYRTRERSEGGVGDDGQREQQATWMSNGDRLISTPATKPCCHIATPPRANPRSFSSATTTSARRRSAGSMLLMLAYHKHKLYCEGTPSGDGTPPDWAHETLL
uniref:Uncharacterized protein n=1 Tax=Oryza glumipatula TaxID=40148 RepID=A0A0D9Y810_9ORYZ